MNQMEHNVKIKDYKHYEAPGPFVRTAYRLDYPHNYPNSQEIRRMEERFQTIHWPRNKTLVGLTDQGDRMRFTRDQQTSVLTNQSEILTDVQHHRKVRLDTVKRNIDVARDEFARDVYTGRPGVRDMLRGTQPLYKVINNGTLYG